MPTLQDLLDAPKGTALHVIKGALVFSAKNHEPQVNQRTRLVKLHRVDKGWSAPIHSIVGDRELHEKAIAMGYDLEALKALANLDRKLFYDGKLVMRKPRVIWSGTGQYWHETDIENVVFC